LSSQWYHKKQLFFACTQCGDCCKRPGYVYLHAFEADRIAKRLHGEHATAASLIGELWVEDQNGTFRLDVPEEEVCPFLDSNGCTIHDIKPLQCATYPFWDELLARESHWMVESQACKGIGKGRPYSFHEINGLRIECARTFESKKATKLKKDEKDEKDE